MTDSLIATWFVMAVLIILAIVVRTKLKSFKEVPSGFQNVIETAIEAMINFSRGVLGDKLDILGGYFFTVFAFIFASNYSGMLGLRPPTSDIATTLSLGLVTFVLIHIVGIKFQKAEYFKAYLKPFPLFLPVNIIGELARPVSLSFRLFGNILGGLIIMELVYSMLPFFLRFAVPSALHAYFDVFSGALQAFVFTILSMTFISLQTGEES